MAVGYSLHHLQGAPVEASPTWIDIPGITTWEPSITADSTPVKADGQTYVTAYASPEGSGNLTFIDANLGVFALLNGGTVSSSGTGPTEIERYEQPGQYVPVPFSLSDWVPNIDRGHDPDVAGMRTTVPNATAAPVTRTSGQETIFEWTAATTFYGIDPDPMIIYEKLATAPTFALEVFTVPAF